MQVFFVSQVSSLVTDVESGQMIEVCLGQNTLRSSHTQDERPVFLSAFQRCVLSSSPLASSKPANSDICAVNTQQLYSSFTKNNSFWAKQTVTQGGGGSQPVGGCRLTVVESEV